MLWMQDALFKDGPLRNSQRLGCRRWRPRRYGVYEAHYSKVGACFTLYCDRCSQTNLEGDGVLTIYRLRLMVSVQLYQLNHTHYNPFVNAIDQKLSSAPSFRSNLHMTIARLQNSFEGNSPGMLSRQHVACQQMVLICTCRPNIAGTFYITILLLVHDYIFSLWNIFFSFLY